MFVTYIPKPSLNARENRPIYHQHPLAMQPQNESKDNLTSKPTTQKASHLLHSIPHTRPTPLTPPPNPLPPNKKHKRHRNKQRREPPRNTRARPHSQMMIKGTHNKRKRTRKTRSQKSIRRNSRRRVQRKRIDEIIQRSLKNHEKPGSNHGDADAGCNPMDVRGTRPSHDELAGGEKNTA
jgi:hypothetical protein